MSPKDISAVIVTKGDVDLSPILESLPFDDIVVWDNSKEAQDAKVYGRYLGIERAKHDFVYVQDDDCIIRASYACVLSRWPELCRLGVTGHRHVDERQEILCNVPSPDHRKFYDGLGMSLVGWGAIFHRSLVGCFEDYFAQWPKDELFLRECDRVFTSLNPFYNVQLPITHLAHAHGKDRMGMEKRHGNDLAEIRRRIAQVDLNLASRAEFGEATRS